MIALLCAISAIASPICNDHQLSSHWFSQYGQEPTDGTMEYRWSVGDIPLDMSLYAGVIAVEDCRRIGQEAMINVKNKWRRVMVFDCLARNEHNWMQEKNIIAELGFYLARKAGVNVGEGVKGNLVWLEENERKESQKKSLTGPAKNVVTKIYPLLDGTQYVSAGIAR